MRKIKIRGKSGRAGAYMTVEAAFIIPAAFALVVSLLYLSFYMYDRCLLDQDLYMACFRQSAIKEGSGISPKSPPVPEDAAYFMVQGGIPQVSVRTDGHWVRGRGTAAVRAFPSPNSLLTAFSGDEAGCGTRAYRLDPAFHIRRFRRLRNLAGKFMEYLKDTDTDKD